MPSVEAIEKFEIAANQEKCWSFLSNLQNIGSCIPGCESVSMTGETSAEFKVKVRVGYLSKTFLLRAKLVELVPPRHLTFNAEGQDAEISGNLDLNGSQEKLTTLNYKIEIKPVSLTGKTAISMLGRDIVRKQASEFASCVKSKLEN